MLLISVKNYLFNIIPTPIIHIAVVINMVGDTVDTWCLMLDLVHDYLLLVVRLHAEPTIPLKWQAVL